MVTKLLGLILLLTPIAYKTNIQLDKFDLIVFQLGTIALVLASLFDKPVREISREIRLFIISLMGICFINLFLSDLNMVIISAYANLFFGIMALVIIIRYVTDYERLYKYIQWCVIINLIVFTFQKFGINFGLTEYIQSGEEGGLLGNAPRLCSYFCIVTPILLKGKFLWSIPLIIVSLMVKEFTILSVLMITMLFMVNSINYRKTIVLLSVLGSIAALALFHDKMYSSFYARWNSMWIPTIKATLLRPLFGHGIGMFPQYSPNFTSFSGGRHLVTPFNSYLNFIFCTGMIGAIWVVLVVKKFKKHFRKNTESLSVLALLILAIFESPFEIQRFWFTIAFVLGIFIIKNCNTERIDYSIIPEERRS